MDGPGKVLDDWYITAYEPIPDITGQRVGMFYVGVLEAKYRDVREKALFVFTAITLAGLAVAMVLGWLITGRIMRPVSYLIRASAEISSGNFSPDIGPISKDDIGLLQRKFMNMTRALKRRERRQQVKSQIQLIQSEKQASVGKLAAGVAHEINNPLTAVLTFTHLILRRSDLADEVRSDLQIVAAQTERVRGIVKSLLDFSRQSALAPEPTDLNQFIEDTVRLMKNQALVKGVEMSFHRDDRLPHDPGPQPVPERADQYHSQRPGCHRFRRENRIVHPQEPVGKRRCRHPDFRYRLRHSPGASQPAV